ncbi:hypothetical protein [Pseudomonas umsongensis]|uniref:hypothetical protein n=1 Tax=Pseudomonas umsongensis TaxID=198618 RepID=UPI00200B0CC1|nr:hypothetical protein [Pseudomonas umsongensis]MCK8685360.1 hypothetical protein [Pseudomonas umsongensis]
MARSTQEKSESTPATGGGGDTVEKTDLSSAPVDAQVSTVASPFDNSPPLTPQASDADADASGNQVVIYPIRSYLDGKEIRQAGGAGYASPKHEALLLIAKGLATDTDPKA